MTRRRPNVDYYKNVELVWSSHKIAALHAAANRRLLPFAQ
jgi:hypothetical protein